ncbi:MAG: hypothetical protein AAFQ94_27380, partial [Bacteroidota bacterium]
MQSNIHKKSTLAVTLLLLIIAFGCSNQKTESVKQENTDPNQELKSALTFYASFDNGIDADFAMGDKKLYTSPIKS